jgi:tetratricopeptide (TPR) repeat protein
MGEFDLALADFERSIALEPNYAEVYLFRGLTYADRGDVPLAIADLTRALQLDPNEFRAQEALDQLQGSTGSA